MSHPQALPVTVSTAEMVPGQTPLAQDTSESDREFLSLLSSCERCVFPRLTLRLIFCRVFLCGESVDSKDNQKDGATIRIIRNATVVPMGTGSAELNQFRFEAPVPGRSL